MVVEHLPSMCDALVQTSTRQEMKRISCDDILA